MANKAAEMFMLESRFAVEVKLVDISYWFDKRMKKNSNLNGFVLSVTRCTLKS